MFAGTWCDTALFAELKERINAVKLVGSAELWETLWPLVGGEQAAASVVIAGGTDWEMKLHVFMAKGERAEDAESPFVDSFPTGSLVFLKPLLGITNLRKLRKIGARMVPLGDVMPLKGAASDGSVFGGSEVSDYQLLLGGAVHEMWGTSGPSVVLEIGLLPPMGLPSRHDASLPYFPDVGSPPYSALATAFVSTDLSAEAGDHAATDSPPANDDDDSLETNRIRVGGNSTQATADELTANVGGLGPQLEQIVRRVLVSRGEKSEK